MRFRRERRSAARRGRALVEAALVLPMVFLLLFGIMEYGRYLMTLHLFDNAAREGARYAIAHVQPVVLNGTTYANTTTAVTNVVNSFLGAATLSGQQTQVYLSDSLGNNIGTWTNAQSGNSICVKITGNYTVGVASLLSLPSTLPISSVAVMDCEVQ